MNNIPYTYLIGWAQQNRWYYGSRFATKCHPSDLWQTYFTSSKQVKKFREQNGEPNIIQIRKVFTSIDKCREWEHKVLRRLKVVQNPKWFNKFDGICFDNESRQRGGKLGGKNGHKGKGGPGKPKSREAVAKMIASKTGVKLNISPEAHEARMKGCIKSGNNAVQNKIGIHAWNLEQKKEHNREAGKKTKGLVWLYNPNIKKHTRMRPEFIPSFLQNNIEWIKTHFTKPGKIWVHNPFSFERKQMPLKELSSFLQKNKSWKKGKGPHKSGRNPFTEKTGIFALSKNDALKNAKKAAATIKRLNQIPEFNKLHGQKIRYGKLKARFERLKQQTFFVIDDDF